MSDRIIDTPSSSGVGYNKGTKRKLSLSEDDHSPKQGVRLSDSQDSSSSEPASSYPSSSSRSSSESPPMKTSSWTEELFPKICLKVEPKPYKPLEILQMWLDVEGNTDVVGKISELYSRFSSRMSKQRLKEYIFDVTELIDLDFDCISEIPFADLERLRMKIKDIPQKKSGIIESVYGQFCEICDFPRRICKICKVCWKFCCIECYNFHQTMPELKSHSMVDLEVPDVKHVKGWIFESIHGKCCEICDLPRRICKICKVCWKFYCIECYNFHQRMPDMEIHEMIDLEVPGLRQTTSGGRDIVQSSINCIMCKKEPFSIICKDCPQYFYCKTCANTHINIAGKEDHRSKMFDLTVPDKVPEKPVVERDIVQSSPNCTMCKKEPFSIICKDCPQYFYCKTCAETHVRLPTKEDHRSKMFDLTVPKTVSQKPVVERSEVTQERLDDFINHLYHMRWIARESDSCLSEGDFEELFVRFVKIFGITGIRYGQAVQNYRFKVNEKEVISRPDCLIFIPYREEKSILAVVEVKKWYSTKEDLEMKRILRRSEKNYTPVEHVSGKLKGQHIGEMLGVLPSSIFGEKGVFGIAVQATEVTLVCLEADEKYLQYLKDGRYPKDYSGASAKYSFKCSILRKEGRKALVEIFYNIALLSKIFS